MALTWCESATAATRDFSFWGSAFGTVSSEGTTTKYGGRSIKTTAPVTNALVRSVVGAVGSAGRLTFWFRVSSVSGSSRLIELTNSSGGLIFFVDHSSGQLRMGDGGHTLSGSTISANTWYRIGFSWSLTSTTNWSAKVYLTAADDVSPAADISGSNADFTLNVPSGVTPATFSLNNQTTSGADHYFSPVVCDDTSDLSDIGDQRVTAKLPNATGNANNFSTVIGASASRWTAISERALSTTNGWKETGSSAVEESYGIENAASGDVDLTGKTIVGRMAWLYGKRDVFAASTSTSVNGSTKTTTTALPSISVTAGQWLVIAFADQILGTAITVAKTAGTSTIGTITALSGPTTSTVRLSKWYVEVTGTGTLTLTFTHDNSANKRAGGVIAFPNISASPLDANPANTTDGTSQYDGPSSGALTQANELVVSMFAFAGPTGDTIAVVGSDDTQIVNDGTSGGSAGGNVVLRMLARAVESTSAVASAMTNTTSNRAGVQGLASFKMSAGGGAGSPKLINDGSDVSIVLTSSNTLYTDITTSASYPSASGKVGMKSTGNLNDTYLYECGVLIVYAPTAAITADRSESLSVASTQTVTRDGAVARTEALSGSESQSVTRDGVVARAESLTATATQTAGTDTAAARAESLAASESQSATVTKSASASESGSASESQDRTVAATRSRDESLTASESHSNTLDAVGAVAESATATATQTAVSTLPVAIDESLTVEEECDATITKEVARAESLTAAETETATMVAVASRTETLTATDAQTGNYDTAAARAESLAATETQAAGTATPAARAESLSCSESNSCVFTGTGSRSESCTATDTPAAVYTGVAARAETLSAADDTDATVTGGGTTHDVDCEESLAVDESQSATAAFAASRAETCTAASSQSTTLTAACSRAETGSLTDTGASTLTAVAARVESLVITDLPSAAKVTAATAAESLGAAASQSATAVFAASCSEAGSLDEDQSGYVDIDHQDEVLAATDSATATVITFVDVVEVLAVTATQNWIPKTPKGRTVGVPKENRTYPVEREVRLYGIDHENRTAGIKREKRTPLIEREKRLARIR